MTTVGTESPRTERACCAEFARLSRRGLLGAGLAGGLSFAVGSAVITAAGSSAASPDPSDDAGSVLVVLSLRGAADGLSLVVPYTDPAYYAARPTIAVPAGQLVATNGTFGLHPALSPLLPLWQAGELAAVQGTGLPAPNRSHFSAMEELEDADPGSARREGWLNRLLGTLPGSSPLRGFGLGGGVLPTSLYGRRPVMSGDDVGDVTVAGVDRWDDGSRMRSLRTLWQHAPGPLGAGMRTAFRAVDGFGPVTDAPSHAKTYPDSDLGSALGQVARIIRGDVGVRVITVDQGDWDMHTDVGTLRGGRMLSNARDLAGSLAAFMDDLGTRREHVTVVALSEFGRRVAENASGGLDHGYGNVMLLAGRGVRGGYHGTLPRLSGSLDADVPVSLDYRSVLAEVVSTRFHTSVAATFPGFRPEPVGVMTTA